MKTLATDVIYARARESQAAWAALGAGQRCAILERLRSGIAREAEAIAELIAGETGKPVLDALTGDVLVTLETMRYYAKRAPKLLLARKTGKPPIFFLGAHFETCHEPHGVVLVFGASNYPLQLSLIPAFTALVAGNAVVLKCSERTPATAALIRRLGEGAGLPPGLLQVFDEGPEQAVALIDARPDLLFFTGSSRNGRMVAERAARQLIPVILELGGKDAALVFADCNLERAVEGIVYGAFSNTGRVCVGVKRAYVEASVAAEFLARLIARVRALRVQRDGDADLFPLAETGAVELRGQVEDALSRGATLHHPIESDGLGYGPMLLTGVPPEARLMREEVFGPVLCMQTFSSEEEAVQLANDSEFALSSSVWTGDRARARRVAARLNAGSCAVNDVIRVIANPHAPFGGNRQSGYGRYHGPEGLYAFSRQKTVLFSGDRRKREINWFPFTARTRRQLAALLQIRHGQRGLLAWLLRLLPVLLVGAAISLATVAQKPPATHLTIHVQLLARAHGELAYLIFNSADGFPGDRDKAIRHGFLPVAAGTQQMKIEADLPPGTYAVSVYEDLNGNHKLDHNFLGIPTEPVGASNNPHPHFGPPGFGECSFHIGTTSQTIFINIVRGL